MNIPFTPILANWSPQTMLFVLVILLLMFGAKKLPDLAKGLGQAIREFSKAKNEVHDEIMREANNPTPPRIETPVQTASIPQPAGTQPTSASQSAPAQHTETHA